MRRLSVDIDVFDHYADTIGLFLDVDGLLVSYQLRIIMYC